MTGREEANVCERVMKRVGDSARHGVDGAAGRDRRGTRRSRPMARWTFYRVLIGTEALWELKAV